MQKRAAAALLVLSLVAVTAWLTGRQIFVASTLADEKQADEKRPPLKNDAVKRDAKKNDAQKNDAAKPDAAKPDTPKGDAKQTPTKTFMREKLKDAQKVLEGLATEDFKLIKEGAEHMKVMSQAVEWHIIEGPVYAEHSAEFRRCCEQLAKRADDKNMHAATLSYMQLTMACVNCHSFVRSTQVAGNAPPALPDNATLFATTAAP